MSQTAWQSFLQQQGIAPERDALSAVRAAASGDVLTDLSGFALIRANGDEAVTFLQGQLTHDTRLVTESASQLSGYCTPKGRLLALPRLFRRQNDLFLQMPAPIAEGVLKRLKMYILRSKVTLALAEDLVAIGLSGPHAPALVRAQVGEPPAAPNAVITANDVTVIAIAGPHPRFELVGPVERMTALWTAWASAATTVGAAAWDWLDIQAGLPTVVTETQEAFVPQMTNLDLLEGISLTKGCYTGQEIVARTHYLGKLKQRMFRAHTGAEAPVPGTTVYAASFGDQGAGTVVMAQPSPTGGSDLLVVMQRSVAEIGEAHLSALDGPVMTLQPLPYALPA